MKTNFQAVNDVLGIPFKRLPKTIIILLENVLRHRKREDLDCLTPFKQWLKKGVSNTGIDFKPARVLMQDFTGVPAVVDLAAMRDAVAKLGSDPSLG